MAWLELGVVLLIAYAIGAIPNGFVVGRLLGRNLLREGSGKIGTTNTLRVLGRPAGALVFVLDLVKGLIPGLLVGLVAWPDPAWRDLALGGAGAAAVAGHNWSVWVRLVSGQWGGGRGLVPALGAMLLVHPLISLVGLLGAALGLAASRYLVIGAVVGVGAAFAMAAVLVAVGSLSPWLFAGSSVTGLLVLLGFQDNLRRLARGQEARLGAAR